MFPQGRRAFVLFDLDAIFHPESNDLHVLPDIGPDDLPPDWRFVWEERAAIMEYDGGLPKEHAEAAALTDVLELMRRHGIAPTCRPRRF
jgi:hypothetical protein